ncbi:MAG: lysophospholipase, partial [Actinomycetota bacterium]|nr:lysophospholipase [Actinomycetota bacterium]
MGRAGRVIAAEGFLSGVGGRRIFWQSWSPDSEPRAAVIIVHGASEHSGRYGHVAQALVADGYGVYALDHRGHGRSDGPRAVIDRLANAVADIDRLVSQVRAEHPALPIVMLGHSMGGTVSVSYTIRHQERLTGLILSGPLAALEAAPAPLRMLGRVLSVLAPRLPLIDIDASLVSRDPEVVRDYRADPLNHHGKLPARTIDELARAIDDFPEAVTTITLPVLILYGTADRLAPPSGAQMLERRIGAADKTTIAYPGLFHEILNEPEREAVLTDICGWLAERLDASVAE